MQALRQSVSLCAPASRVPLIARPLRASAVMFVPAADGPKPTPHPVWRRTVGAPARLLTADVHSDPRCAVIRSEIVPRRAFRRTNFHWTPSGLPFLNVLENVVAS